MAWPKHFRFVFRGTFQGSPEAWSFGCHFRRTSDAAPDADYGDIDQSAVTTAIGTYLAAVSASQVVLQDWRCYRVEETGRLPEFGSPLLVTAPAGAIHGAGDLRYPPQIASKVTTCALLRGPANKGGWFIPGPRAQIDPNDPRMVVSECIAVANSSSAFLKAISDAIDLPGTIDSAEALNVSQGPPGSTTGTSQVVDHVEVGRVFDTIRNRRKSLVEDRQVAAHIDW